MNKKCHKCGQTKDATQFRKDKTQPDGLSFYCTQCKRKLESSYREINRETIRKKDREHYRKNRDRIIKSRKDNYDPVKSRARWLARKIRAKKCIFCDQLGDRHHEDYEHPLDIVFLCKAHHKQVHDGTLEI